MQTTLQSAPPASQTATRLSGFWGSFKKSRSGIIGLWMMVAIVLIAIFAPVIAPYDQSSSSVQIGDIYQRPSAQHWFGTDDAGQDVFSNFVYGARVSLTVGFFAAFISIIIGGSFGLIAGFFGGQLGN